MKCFVCKKEIKINDGYFTSDGHNFCSSDCSFKHWDRLNVKKDLKHWGYRPDVTAVNTKSRGNILTETNINRTVSKKRSVFGNKTEHGDDPWPKEWDRSEEVKWLVCKECGKKVGGLINNKCEKCNHQDKARREDDHDSRNTQKDRYQEADN